jgi:threonine aldolase
VENKTNQIFPVMPDTVLEQLGKKYGYCYMERVDETHSAVRFCTSWATRPEAVDALEAML